MARRTTMLAGILALAAGAAQAAPGHAQDEADFVRCTKCKNVGAVPCSEHKRKDCELEDNVLYCSVVAGCTVCGGTGWSDCAKCVNPASEERLAAKRDRQGELSREPLEVAEKMERELRLALSEHFLVVCEIDRMKVGKANLDGHALLHTWVDRLEALYADYVEVLGVPEDKFKKRLRVMLWDEAADHEKAGTTFCSQSASRGVKLMGIDPVYTVHADKRFYKDDEVLHRNVVHHTTHLLLSHQSPSRWIGRIKGGWADAGLAHWFEDRAFGLYDNYCYQEVFSNKKIRGDDWRVKIRKLVASDKAPALGELFQQNTETLSVEQHMASLALIDFLMQEDPLKLNDLLTRMRSKIPTRDAIKIVYDWKIFDMEEKWRAWVLDNYSGR